MAFELERKTVELPTGRTVIIRKAGLLTLQRIYKKLPVLTAEDTKDPKVREAKQTDASFKAILACVVECSLEPRFTLEPFPTDPNLVSLDELSNEELTQLIKEIDDFTDLEGAKAEVRPFSATEAGS